MLILTIFSGSSNFFIKNVKIPISRPQR